MTTCLPRGTLLGPYSERRRRAQGLAGVALGGFGPPFGLMAVSFAYDATAFAIILVMTLAGATLGVLAVRDANRAGDVPGGAFGVLAVFASAAWLVGFAMASLLPT